MSYDPYAYYGYYGSAAAETGSAAVIMLVLLGVYYLLIFAVAIGAYVLQSIGMYTIAQRRGIRHPWLAWVPVGNMWILGSISDQYQYVTQGKVRNRRKLLLGLEIALVALALAICGVAVYAAVQTIMAGGDATYALTGGLGLVLLWLVMFVLAIILAVFQYVCLYNLYASCEPGNKTVYLLLSIFVGVTLPILVFVCRKKDLGMPPRRPAPAPVEPPVRMDPPAFEE